MSLESLAYSLFGNNLVIGKHIRRQLAFLKEIVPDNLLHRNMDDLGCGDGKVTVLLEEIFQPSKLRAFDVNPGLVRRARKKGIDAQVGDLNTTMPSGELGVLWGVLHHLEDYDKVLQRMKENYPLIFIREPVRNGRIRELELGSPLSREKLVDLINRHMPDSQIHVNKDCLLIFCIRSGYGGQGKDME